jgi:hypothetical protein
LKTFDEEVSENFGNLDPQFFKQYAQLIKFTNSYYTVNHPVIIHIGMLQILRKLITKQIYFSAKVESSLYTSCLETVNYTILHNLDEIKDTAKRTFVEKEEELF